LNGYTLVVCEKPDAARRVSEALSDGKATSAQANGVAIFRFRALDEDFVVCAAQGHLYAVSDPLAERSVYPAFDVEWYGNDLVEKGAAGAARRIQVIRDLAKGARRFVNACDYDVEGETIGFNILRYACGGKEGEALRARFSTLTKEDLASAFASLEKRVGQGMAEAGRARHAMDFVWGVNLSRALSQAALAQGKRYRTVSVGRVQGPTLGFVVDRETEIRTFVPLPYWIVTGVFEKDGRRIEAPYLKGRLNRKDDAEEVRRACADGIGVVGGKKRSLVQVPPPPPFNIGDLQKEAYRAFRYTPSRTLQIAEHLYLGALISYPRTGSQKLPPSIGYARILRGLASQSQYSKLASGLLAGELRPVQGTRVDLAHPAIHPTGDKPAKRLEAAESRLYDLVVRRFLSTFAMPARREIVTAEISVNGHVFGLEGRRTVEAGWLSYYDPYGRLSDAEAPRVSDGERLPVVGIRSEEKFEAPPSRYNQSTLLEKMEREGIGTKATRADIIATLGARGYVSGVELTPSDLGASVIEILRLHAPSIVSTELTQTMESELEHVEAGAGNVKRLLRDAIRAASDQLANLESDEERVGLGLDTAAFEAQSNTIVLGACPVCKTGKLHVVKSRKSGKRFVGCTNYSAGCRASAPLPQRGVLRAGAACRHCSWPVVSVKRGRFPWKLCVNPDCPSKGEKKREVRAV
jgi:DNA topoisomerase-1